MTACLSYAKKYDRRRRISKINAQIRNYRSKDSENVRFIKELETNNVRSH